MDDESCTLKLMVPVDLSPRLKPSVTLELTTQCSTHSQKIAGGSLARNCGFDLPRLCMINGCGITNSMTHKHGRLENSTSMNLKKKTRTTHDMQALPQTKPCQLVKRGMKHSEFNRNSNSNWTCQLVKRGMKYTAYRVLPRFKLKQVLQARSRTHLFLTLLRGGSTRYISHHCASIQDPDCPS